MLKKILLFLKKKYNEVFYVGAIDKLPPPLNKDEELAAIIKAQQGDMEARNKLIEHNLRLVVFLAKKYESSQYDIEDLVSIGSIGLIKGINTYKLDKNIKLATYASRCIANEILMFLRKNKKRNAEVSLDEVLNYDNDGNELHLEDVIGTENELVPNLYQEKVNKEFLNKEVMKLNKRDKEIITLRYGLNNTKEYTQKEVAELLGISQSYISRIEKKVIKKIKQVI